MDYGNARLRAIRARLLTDADYTRLMGFGSVEGLLAALADTSYEPDVEAAMTRYRGLRRFDDVLQRHLARRLRAMLRFYEDPERRTIELLLERWDLRNLRTILRGQTQLPGSTEILRSVVPAGRLDTAELRELAAQPGLRATVDLMAAWAIPSQATSRCLLDVWADYERSGDMAVLERALNIAFAEHLDTALGEDDDEVGAVLRAEIDETNLLTALRLRSARRRGEIVTAREDPIQRFLPAGRIPFDALAEVAATDDASAVVSRLVGAKLVPGWSDALSRWADHDDLVALTEELQTASTRRAVGLFSRGDPLGFAVPVAFTRAQEHEVRNLRWIGRGIVHGFDPAEIEARVVVIR
ncbi:MAG: V-type ATPase subunit [Actinomycetota bacterium]|nr:V-type ATPase subunit [Actinomycetota bacterium]